MKKLLLTGLILFTLCGCGRHDENTVTLWTLQMGDFSEYMNKIITKYEKLHPDIKIDWIDVPFSEGEKRTLAAVLGNNPPDLINLNPDFTALLAQIGALEKISDKKAVLYNSQIVQCLKYNGELYSLPWYATSSITFINKKLLEKTNIGKEEKIVKKVKKQITKRHSKIVEIQSNSTPEPMPVSYTQLNNYAEEVKRLSGAYVYIPNLTENDTMLRILNKYGINSPEKVNSQQSVQLFNQFRNLYKSDFLPKETVSITHREAFEQYMSGKSVFFQAGANFLNMLKENAPDIYTTTSVAPQIIGSCGQYDFSLMNFVIPLKAKNKQAALDFCLYLTNGENQLELAQLTNVIATNNEALKSPFYNDYSTLQSKARSLSAKQLNKVNPVMKQQKNQKELNTLINTAVQRILTSKENETQKILDKLSMDWATLIAE